VTSMLCRLRPHEPETQIGTRGRIKPVVVDDLEPRRSQPRWAAPPTMSDCRWAGGGDGAGERWVAVTGWSCAPIGRPASCRARRRWSQFTESFRVEVGRRDRGAVVRFPLSSYATRSRDGCRPVIAGPGRPDSSASFLTVGLKWVRCRHSVRCCCPDCADPGLRRSCAAECPR